MGEDKVDLQSDLARTEAQTSAKANLEVDAHLKKLITKKREAVVSSTDGDVNPQGFLSGMWQKAKGGVSSIKDFVFQVFEKDENSLPKMEEEFDKRLLGAGLDKENEVSLDLTLKPNMSPLVGNKSNGIFSLSDEEQEKIKKNIKEVNNSVVEVMHKLKERKFLKQEEIDNIEEFLNKVLSSTSSLLENLSSQYELGRRAKLYGLISKTASQSVNKVEAEFLDNLELYLRELRTSDNGQNYEANEILNYYCDGIFLPGEQIELVKRKKECVRRACLNVKCITIPEQTIEDIVKIVIYINESWHEVYLMILSRYLSEERHAKYRREIMQAACVASLEKHSSYYTENTCSYVNQVTKYALRWLV